MSAATPLPRRPVMRARISRSDARQARRAHRLAEAAYLAACALPAALWAQAIRDIADGARPAPGWAAGALPWALMTAGLAFLLPVAASAGCDPAGRWYPRARNAYAAWGISLYLLGFGLATQVAQMMHFLTA